MLPQLSITFKNRQAIRYLIELLYRISINAVFSPHTQRFAQNMITGEGRKFGLFLHLIHWLVPIGKIRKIFAAG